MNIRGFIQYPYGIHEISNMHNPDVRNTILRMNEGDVLSIAGLGWLEVARFDIVGRVEAGEEIRELYITTYPV